MPRPPGGSQATFRCIRVWYGFTNKSVAVLGTCIRQALGDSTSDPLARNTDYIEPGKPETVFLAFRFWVEWVDTARPLATSNGSLTAEHTEARRTKELKRKKRRTSDTSTRFSHGVDGPSPAIAIL